MQRACWDSTTRADVWTKIELPNKGTITRCVRARAAPVGRTCLPSDPMAAPADCFCFDLCANNNDQFLAHAGVEFLSRARGVVISSHTSPWVQHYLGAVYNGHMRLPFALWRVNTFYLHTTAWREKHTGES